MKKQLIEIEVKMFGAFRKYENSSIKFPMESDSSVEEVKHQLQNILTQNHPGFSETQLIADSAIANEYKVLANSDRIQAPCKLAILPPVCGG